MLTEKEIKLSDLEDKGMATDIAPLEEVTDEKVFRLVCPIC